MPSSGEASPSTTVASNSDLSPNKGLSSFVKSPHTSFESMEFETRAIHCGQAAEPITGAVVPPIFLTTTYAQEWPGVDKGYDYTRAGNPTFTSLETQLAAIESASYCTSFSAGLAGFVALLSDLVAGDVVVVVQSLYGGTYRLLSKLFVPRGIKLVGVLFSELSTLNSVFSSLSKPASYFIFETPTNPLMEVIDISKVSAVAHSHNITVVCDNTFASPYLQNPLLLGADVVLHSCTKYIGGHSDVIGGAVMTNDDRIDKKVKFHRMAMGLNPSPFDCWLLTRSLKTLAVRAKQHSENGMLFARYLRGHKAVKSVYYPGLSTHPGHHIAKAQMREGMFGGMVSAEFNLTTEEAKKLVSCLKVFSLAESLGGVESLVCHPTTMTHASIPAEERRRIGLADGLIRFSCGIENAQDLINDVDQALLEISKGNRKKTDI